MRNFSTPSVAVLIMLGSMLFTASPAMADTTDSPSRQFVYIGTMVTGGEPGIYRFAFDTATGTLEPLGTVSGIGRPSFLALSPDGEYLYAAGELGEGKQKTGGAAAYRIDDESGELTLLNTRDTGGGGACYVAVDATGRCVMAANYGGGSVASFPVDADGSLGERASFIQHEGSSVTPRQKGPHAHSINPDPTNRFAIAADLGLDKLLVYRLDSAAATLTPHAPPAADITAGSGPRHLTFHPDGRHAYAINELASTVTVLAWDAEAGTLSPTQTVTTLPDNFDGENTTAEVAISPDGRFLYGSNRGDDSLAVFAIDPDDGTLTPAGHTPTGGQQPRHFRIDPTGAFLIAANQKSNSLVVFRIDRETGNLTRVGDGVTVPTPVCVKFLPR